MHQYFDPEIETMSPAKLKEWESELIQKQLVYVMQNSPFYQRKFAEAGVNPEKVKRIEDLAQLPFTTKEELRRSQEEAPPLGLHAAVPMEKVIRIHSSSGTTGRPSYVGITNNDHRNWTHTVARVYYTEGVRPESKVIHGFGLGFFVGGLPLKDAIESIGATFIPIGTGASDRLYSSIRDIKADVLTCTPSYALYLAEYIREKFDTDPATLGIKKVMCGAEPGGGIPSIRKRIAEDWGATVTEGLGNADMAPVIFGECGESEGMHFCGQGFVHCEIIDPDTGEVLPIENGVKGELVYTSLNRECVPLIRFRTRDHVEVWNDRCSCGRTSFRMRCIGRTDDMLIVLGVNVFPSAIKDVISSLRPLTTGEIQVLLPEPGPKVEPPLRIKVEYGPDNEVELPQLKKQVEGLLRDKLIFSSNVELVPPGTLPRYEMKAQLIKKLWLENV
ncbi:phenylacetate--CoA ligase family protein [Paradesulfitobacterium ferrireducens]|uniref:phenylacetate--CoA ligase family protein n=1 Tax=Paradesulfitobacterium ferrireducens TaxID=2816476 RepID=UPI001A8FE849|nr:AMP-binding protein [Paradesulfitobacterium ferrireducens]